MKNNKKGFTLIELLAVIVILAIIALIATPIVLNIIAKARKSAAQDSLYGVIEAAKTTYMSSLLDDAQITLPMAVECDGSSCLVYGASGIDASTGAYTKGTQQKYTVGSGDTAKEEPFVVSFSGTIPGETGEGKTAIFVIDSDGKVIMTQKDDDTKKLIVNGYKCSIDAKEKVTCN